MQRICGHWTSPRYLFLTLPNFRLIFPFLKAAQDESPDAAPFHITGYIPPGMPSVYLPHTALQIQSHNKVLQKIILPVQMKSFLK